MGCSIGQAIFNRGFSLWGWGPAQKLSQPVLINPYWWWADIPHHETQLPYWWYFVIESAVVKTTSKARQIQVHAVWVSRNFIRCCFTVILWGVCEAVRSWGGLALPRDLLEVKDRMLHNGVYFCANYATWHYLATLGHEMPRIFSTFVRTWSTCIILHHMVPILCHTAFSSLSMSFLIFLRIYAFASCFLVFFFSPVGVQWLQVVLLQAAILLGLLSNIWALLLGTAFCGVTYALLSPERSVEDQVSSSYRELPKRTGER